MTVVFNVRETRSAWTNKLNQLVGLVTGITWDTLSGKPSTFTPSAHTQAASTISDSTATGRAVLTATDQAAARAAIGAGTSSFDGTYASLTGKPTLGTLASQNGTFSGTSSGTNTGDNAVNSLYSGLATSKQDALVSGTNIKTINGASVLGSGNLTVTAGDPAYSPGSFTVATETWKQLGKDLKLTGSQRATILGTGRLRISN